VKGVTDAGLKARPLKKLAVLGGGLMGSGIATAAVLSGMEVLLKEVNQQFLDVSMGHLIRLYNIVIGVQGRAVNRVHGWTQDKQQC
jgi:hypothetical protein